MENLELDFELAKAKLFLKLKEGDATYTVELAKINEILAAVADPQMYRQALGRLLLRLGRGVPEGRIAAVEDAITQTGSASIGLFRMQRSLYELDGKSADLQASGLRTLMQETFPADASTENKQDFYIECLNMSIVTNNNALIAELILAVEGLQEKEVV